MPDVDDDAVDDGAACVDVAAVVVDGLSARFDVKRAHLADNALKENNNKR